MTHQSPPVAVPVGASAELDLDSFTSSPRLDPSVPSADPMRTPGRTTVSYPPLGAGSGGGGGGGGGGPAPGLAASPTHRVRPSPVSVVPGVAGTAQSLSDRRMSPTGASASRLDHLPNGGAGASSHRSPPSLHAVSKLHDSGASSNGGFEPGGKPNPTNSLFNLLWVPDSPSDGTARSRGTDTQPGGSSSRTTGSPVLSSTVPGGLMAGPTMMGPEDDEEEPLLPPPVSGAVTAFGVPAGLDPSRSSSAFGGAGINPFGGQGAYADPVASGSASGSGLSLPSLASLNGASSSAGLPSSWSSSSNGAFAAAAHPQTTAGNGLVQHGEHGSSSGQGRNAGIGYLPRPSMALYRYSSSGSSSALDDPLYRSASFSSSSQSFSGSLSGNGSYYGAAPGPGGQYHFGGPGIIPPPSAGGSADSLLDSSDGGRFSSLGLRSGASSADTGMTSWGDESERGEGYNAKRRRSDEAVGIPSAQMLSKGSGASSASSTSKVSPASVPRFKDRTSSSSTVLDAALPPKKPAFSDPGGYIAVTKPLSGRPPRNGPPQQLTGLPAGAPSTVTALGHKRKHVCTWDGCGKGFTTSGHLARHHRIHTGEKRYECLMPGCVSRFSRQDNMLQHYRTHLSGKSRRISSLDLPIEPSHAAAAEARLQAHAALLDGSDPTTGLVPDDLESVSGSSSGGRGIKRSGGGGPIKPKTLGRPPSYAWEGQPYGLVFDDAESVTSGTDQGTGSDRTKASPPQHYQQVPPAYTYQTSAQQMPPPSTQPWLQAVGNEPSTQHENLRRYTYAGAPSASEPGYAQQVPGSYNGVGSNLPSMGMNGAGAQIHHHFHHHFSQGVDGAGPSNQTVPPTETFRSRSYDYAGMPPPRAPASFMSSASYNGHGEGGGYGGPASWRLSSSSSDSSSGGIKPNLTGESGASLASYRAALAGHHMQEKTSVLQRQKSYSGPGPSNGPVPPLQAR